MVFEDTRSPTISVIIPVHNGSTTKKSCLEAVLTSNYSSYQCIVVNDGSVDDSAAIVRQFAVQLLELPEGRFGPAYARNRGAEAARGKILLFVDADVVLAPGALHLIARIFHKEPDLAAVFGSYDDHPSAKGVISQYRNLLHHFVHQNGDPEASTFWAGCGAIRRSVFEQVDGFDESDSGDLPLKISSSDTVFDNGAIEFCSIRTPGDSPQAMEALLSHPNRH